MSATGGDAVGLVETGTANRAAVVAAFSRLGRTCTPATTPRDVLETGHVVLPGVGSFASGVEALARAGLGEALRERVDAGRPTLAICLGLQLLCASSEEAPGVPGLACVHGHVERFSGDVRVPQLGWNDVTPGDHSRFLTAGVAYFANSYRLDDSPEGWIPSVTHYGGAFVAALERGDVLACQFHPELSGAWGADILRKWLARPC